METQEEVDEDEKGSYILHGEVEVKEAKNKKATANDDVSGDVLRLLGENSLKIVSRLFSHIYGRGVWPKIS
jgi:hypothetical protein